MIIFGGVCINSCRTMCMYLRIVTQNNQTASILVASRRVGAIAGASSAANDVATTTTTTTATTSITNTISL